MIANLRSKLTFLRRFDIIGFMNKTPGRIEGHRRGSEWRGVFGFVLGGVIGSFISANVLENGKDLLNDPFRILAILVVAVVSASVIGAVAYRTGNRTFPVVGSK